MDARLMDVIRALQAGPFDETTLQRVRASLAALRREEKLSELDARRKELLDLLDGFARSAESAHTKAQTHVLAADLCDLTADREGCVEFLALSLDTDPLSRTVAHRLQAALSSEQERPRLMALLTARIQALSAASGVEASTLADAYVQIGKLYADAGELDQAIAAYSDALDQEPDVSTVEALAELYVGRRAPGDVERAADLYCALFDVLPSPEGLAYLKRALELVPDHDTARARWADQPDAGPLPAPAVAGRAAGPPGPAERPASPGPRVGASTVMGLGPPLDLPPPAISPASGPPSRRMTIRVSELPIAPPPAAGHVQPSAHAPPGHAAPGGAMTSGPRVAQAAPPASAAAGGVTPAPPPAVTQVPPAPLAKTAPGPVLPGAGSSSGSTPSSTPAPSAVPASAVSPGSSFGPAPAAPSSFMPTRSAAPALDREIAAVRRRGRRPWYTAAAVLLLGSSGAYAFYTGHLDLSRADDWAPPWVTARLRSYAPGLFGDSVASAGAITTPPPGGSASGVGTTGGPRVAAADGGGGAAAAGSELTAPAAAEEAPAAAEDVPAAEVAEEAATKRVAGELSPPVTVLRRGTRFSGARVARKRFFSALDGTLPTLEQCYEVARQRRPELEGRLVLQLRLRRSGTTSSVKRVGGTIRDRRLSACAGRALKGTRFPRLRRGRRAKVRLPFEFSAEG